LVHGSWLKAHGSCLKARASRLRVHDQESLEWGPPPETITPDFGPTKLLPEDLGISKNKSLAKDACRKSLRCVLSILENLEYGGWDQYLPKNIKGNFEI